MIKDMLKFLRVLEVVSNEERVKNGLKRLGKGYSEAYRLNPYNPLTYLLVIILMIVWIPMFGIVGLWIQLHEENLFEWN